jgi:transcription-repair coupling factor (superfamily II helicase)
MHKLTFLTPFSLEQGTQAEALSKFAQQANLGSFEPVLFQFTKALSQSLLKDSQYKQYPELVALGFWLRSSHLKSKLKQVGYDHVSTHSSTDEYKPIGCVVHFTPANVDTMFIYSWIASLLLGNTNIIRVASQDSQSKIMLLALLNKLFTYPEFEQIRARNVFVTYDKQSHFTDELSALADARLIWGGDQSVRLIKQSSSKQNCRDLSFADKYSLSIVNLNEIEKNCDQYAQLLWRDTQAFYQQACSSPRIVIFVVENIGENISENCATKTSLIKSVFAKVNLLAKEDSKNWQDDTRLNEHLVTIQSLSIQSYIEENGLLQLDQISAAFVEPITQETMAQHKGNGLYYIALATTVEDALDKLVFSDAQSEHAIAAKVQTISVYGFDKEKLRHIAGSKLGQTSFRVQDQGQALDFSFRWDGYNLLQSLSCKK